MAKITSLILHIAALVLLLLLTVRSPAPPAPHERDAVPLVLPMRLVAHSGGSNQTEQPAKHGQPPPRALRTFILPASQPNPRLAIPITVEFDSPTFVLDTASIGDPSSKLLDGALGRLGGIGIGDGPGKRGIGPGGFGPPGISLGPSGHRITQPQLIFKVEPEFSEEARKAKYQGTVVLAIEVDTNGRAKNPRVLQAPGLGLDEKAIEAVTRWRFRPGSDDGKPIVTSATVEVTFHLL